MCLVIYSEKQAAIPSFDLLVGFGITFLNLGVLITVNITAEEFGGEKIGYFFVVLIRRGF